MSSYSTEQLIEALFCIKEGKLTFKDVAIRTGIREKTLERNYNRVESFGWDLDEFRALKKRNNNGRSHALSRVEEVAFENVILEWLSKGFTVTSTNIKQICFEYCEKHGIEHQFSRKLGMAGNTWYKKFLQRHPKVNEAMKKQKTTSHGNKDQKPVSERKLDEKDQPTLYSLGYRLMRKKKPLKRFDGTKFGVDKSDRAIKKETENRSRSRGRPRKKEGEDI